MLKTFKQLVLGITIILSTMSLSVAQTATTFTRPITIVVPFAPGGTTDLAARLLAQEIQHTYGTQVIVENRPGAFALVGARHMLNQPPDGHTWLIAANGITAHHHFNSQPEVQLFRRLAPVSMIMQNAMVLVTPSQMPVQNLNEFLTLVRQSPQQLNYATIGGGGVVTMASEWFLRETQTRTLMQPVPYTGGAPALVDLQAGRIHMMFDSTVVGLRNHVSGRVRALAVTGPTRSALAPDVPTLQEMGINMNMMTWQAIFLHDQTPEQLQQVINNMLHAVINNSQVRERFLALGADDVIGGTLEQVRHTVQQEFHRWDQVFTP